ncbi:hypothetical protein Ngar_c03680 [Candidatus Nitrososphaera gargensis Ga9.2]|nr:hypothetical protein Ngar_c03680 [Candidatus Nitrososphaera gargensis Ga9.2]
MADETKKAQYVLGAITYDDTTGLVTIEINTPNTALMTEGQKQTIKNEIASWVEFMGWEADSA